MHRYFYNLIVISTASILLSACANRYDSNKRIADPPANITKVFVAVKTGNQKHSPFAEEILTGATKDLQNCGIEATGDTEPAENDTLSLTPAPGKSRKDKIHNFAPDYVWYIEDPFNPIFIERHSNKYVSFIHLPSAPIGQNIWYAQFVFAPMFGLNNGASLADRFFELMQKDGMLPPSCKL